MEHCDPPLFSWGICHSSSLAYCGIFRGNEELFALNLESSMYWRWGT